MKKRHNNEIPLISLCLSNQDIQLPSMQQNSATSEEELDVGFLTAGNVTVSLTGLGVPYCFKSNHGSAEAEK